MATLAERLLDPDTRPALVQASVRVIEAEVGSKGGLKGLAIKTAFKTVKAFKPGIIPDVVNVLIDEFVEKLEPSYAEFQEAGENDFGAWILRRSDETAETLLSITDRRADGSRHKTLVKAYRKLRPQGKNHVMAAMPRIGDMLRAQGL